MIEAGRYAFRCGSLLLAWCGLQAAWIGIEPGAICMADDALPLKALEGAAFWVGDPLSRNKTSAPHDTVTCLTFTPNGRRLLIGKENGMVTTVDTRHGRVLHSVKAHDERLLAILHLPAARSYITVSTNSIREWSVGGKEPIDVHVESFSHLTSAAVSPDGKRLAVTGDGYSDKGSVSIYDTDSRTRTHILTAGKWPTSVGFSQDGNCLLWIAREDARIKLWDLVKGELVWSRGDNRVAPGRAVDQTCLSACAFGPGGQEYAMAIESFWVDSTFCICDLQTGAIRKELPAMSGSASLALSPDGNWIATDGLPPAVEIWDTESGKRVRRLGGHRETVRCLAFSPDSLLLASGGDDGSVIVWHAPPLARARTIPKPR